MQHNYLTLLNSHQLTHFRVCRVSCLCASHSLPKQISHSRYDCRCILEGRSVTEILFLRILLSAFVWCRSHWVAETKQTRTDWHAVERDEKGELLAVGSANVSLASAGSCGWQGERFKGRVGDWIKWHPQK